MATRSRVSVVVLGDIGRSPRMQYHSLSFAKEGYDVDVIGYEGSQPIKELREHPNVRFRFLTPCPEFQKYCPRLLAYILKTIWLTITLFFSLLFKGRSHHILVQNPPAIPSLVVCWFYSILMFSNYVIDWHNYGHTILALSLHEKHKLVKISEWFESYFGRKASANLCVTKAMKENLQSKWGIKATTLYDRPPETFKTISVSESHKLFATLAKEYPMFGSNKDSAKTLFTEIKDGEVVWRDDRPGLLVSSTSWTEDEDFSTLLSALQATHVLLSKWAPVEERSIMSAIIYAGSALGTVLSMLFSGLIINWLDWQSVFYIMGSLPLIWCILWIWLIQDDPIKQQYITEQERSYIVKSIRKTEEKHKISVPWKDVWTSVPFLVIINAHFCNNTCWYFLLTELPTYMFKVLHFDLENNTLMSSLPYLTLWIFSLALSKCLDFGRSNNKITTTTARKISTAFATLIPAACLIAVNFSSDSYVVAGLMAIAVTAMGAMFTGVLTNHIDIAPEFAGTLVGISNTFATIPGIVIPIVVGEITHEGHTPERWSIVIYAIVGILLWEFLVYILFGTGEEQPWNRIKTNNTSTILEDKEKQ